MSGFLLNPYSQGGSLFQFTSFTFIANKYGPDGPTSISEIGYNTTTYPWLSNSLYYSISAGIQTFTVPATGDYDIEVAGASSITQYYSGNTGVYGQSSKFKIRTNLTANTKLKILVGQLPYNPEGYGTTAKPYNGETPSTNCFNGGGGGTFVTLLDNTPIVVAGGGGSVRAGYTTGGTQNSRALSEGPSWPANVGYNGAGTQVPAGTNGGGGTCLPYDQGTAGAGLLGDGDTGISNSYSAAAKSFINGGTGALAPSITATPHGGFGGGGAGGWGGSGGGGGYSGGGGGSNNSSGANGGGGSNFIMSGASIINNHSYYTGSGFVTITKVA